MVDLQEDIETLKKVLEAQKTLPEDEWALFSKAWQPFSVKRKELITHPGQTENHLYFVLEGVQRIYHAMEDGREATLVLTYAQSFGGVLDSFLLQKKSDYYFEALTPTRFLRMHHEQFVDISESCPTIGALFKLNTYEALSGLLTRMKELQCFSSEEKFRVLLNRSPHILQLVPHKYLANYLGIDPTNFSKLLNSVRL